MKRSEAVLVVVDMQEKFVPVIDRFDSVAAGVETLVRGCRILGVPILATEQYPKGLGRTIESLRAAWGGTVSPVEKTAFSCLGEPAFADAWLRLGRRTVVVAGIEAHVCVYQTVRDFLGRGADVELVADAVSSRSARNREIGIERCLRNGARLASVEMVLFEWLERAGGDAFKEISRLVK